MTFLVGLGTPQLGQVFARVETAFPHSLQFDIAIVPYTSTNNPIALRSHYWCKTSLFNSNYSRIMLQSSGYLATERP